MSPGLEDNAPVDPRNEAYRKAEDQNNPSDLMSVSEFVIMTRSTIVLIRACIISFSFYLGCCVVFHAIPT